MTRGRLPSSIAMIVKQYSARSVQKWAFDDAGGSVLPSTLAGAQGGRAAVPHSHPGQAPAAVIRGYEHGFRGPSARRATSEVQPTRACGIPFKEPTESAIRKIPPPPFQQHSRVLVNGPKAKPRPGFKQEGIFIV